MQKVQRRQQQKESTKIYAVRKLSGAERRAHWSQCCVALLAQASAGTYIHTSFRERVCSIQTAPKRTKRRLTGICVVVVVVVAQDALRRYMRNDRDGNCTQNQLEVSIVDQVGRSVPSATTESWKGCCYLGSSIVNLLRARQSVMSPSVRVANVRSLLSDLFGHCVGSPTAVVVQLCRQRVPCAGRMYVAGQ